MTSLHKKYTAVTAVAVTTLLLFLITNIMPYGQQLGHHHHLGFTAEGGACIAYDQSESTITISCNASFLDVIQTINDPDIVENLGNGEYILNANLDVADGVTFEMNSEGDGLQYLKLAGEN